MLSGIGLTFVVITILFVYGRFKLASKQYLAVQTKMIGAPAATTQSDYLATMGHLANQLNRLFRALKSLLCKKKQAGIQQKENTYIPSKTTV